MENNLGEGAVEAGGLESPWVYVSNALRDLVDVGGPVVIILFAMSIFATAIVLLKLWQFQTAHVFSLKGPKAVLALYKSGQALKALETADRDKSPVSHILAGTIRG